MSIIPSEAKAGWNKETPLKAEEYHLKRQTLKY